MYFSVCYDTPVAAKSNIFDVDIKTMPISFFDLGHKIHKWHFQWILISDVLQVVTTLRFWPQRLRLPITFSPQFGDQWWTLLMWDPTPYV